MISIHLYKFGLIIYLRVIIRLCLQKACGLVLHAFKSAEASKLSLGNSAFK